MRRFGADGVVAAVPSARARGVQPIMILADVVADARADVTADVVLLAELHGFGRMVTA